MTGRIRESRRACRGPRRAPMPSAAASAMRLAKVPCTASSPRSRSIWRRSAHGGVLLGDREQLEPDPVDLENTGEQLGRNIRDLDFSAQDRGHLGMMAAARRRAEFEEDLDGFLAVERRPECPPATALHGFERPMSCMIVNPCHELSALAAASGLTLCGSSRNPRDAAGRRKLERLPPSDARRSEHVVDDLAVDQFTTRVAARTALSRRKCSTGEAGSRFTQKMPLSPAPEPWPWSRRVRSGSAPR